ncbi:hypothetical protein X801_09561 [Opisthorchis viverrini]|uniref:RIH domain-containing protein n=1 Tax=Opisthorchis viverrini TaxID=6198 RepID=A0A1S8WK36_OPIVI|nr:hypothetical protein X801_09561 [Opisthorchis viverrini]
MDNNELALALREKQLEKVLSDDKLASKWSQFVRPSDPTGTKCFVLFDKRKQPSSVERENLDWKLKKTSGTIQINVAVYLSRCGVQSNAELLAKGYPDIGWDPVEGERFLDFLRFTVWVNGETVEENANLVVRLLIRRPECLGPALRGGSKTMKPPTAVAAIEGNELPPGGPGELRDAGETTNPDVEAQQTLVGGGLLKAMKEGIVMSAQIKLVKMAQEAEAAGLNPEDEDLGWRTVLMDYEDANLFVPLPYNFECLPPEDSPDYIDLGAAILTFHSVLVNLLGFCAPDMETTKSESVRARSILQSLVSMNDLEGVLSLRFILPPPKLETQES